MNDETMIRITCRDASHPKRREVVASMLRDRDGRWQDWGGRRTAPGVAVVIHESNASTSLDGDAVRDTDWRKPQSKESARIVHTLHCKQCGLNATIRGEKLDPILDKADRAGRTELPLSHFARR